MPKDNSRVNVIEFFKAWLRWIVDATTNASDGRQNWGYRWPATFLVAITLTMLPVSLMYVVLKGYPWLRIGAICLFIYLIPGGIYMRVYLKK